MASMIRETPFSGDTSDSESEATINDAPPSIEMKTANNLPIRDASSLKSSVSNASGVSASPPLRTCAPFTAQNMRSVRKEKCD